MVFERRIAMYYCENCRLLLDSDCCPFCKSDKLREVKDEDYCFLTEKASVYSGVLKEALEKEKIPYETHSAISSCKSLKHGPGVETYRFFVPYSFLNRAKEIEENICTP